MTTLLTRTLFDGSELKKRICISIEMQKMTGRYVSQSNRLGCHQRHGRMDQEKSHMGGSVPEKEAEGIPFPAFRRIGEAIPAESQD